MKDPYDICGCFPTGQHWPGIAHLLKMVIRGLPKDVEPGVLWRPMDIAMIDTETTGTDPVLDRIVELGIAIGRDGEIVDKHNWLINPGIPIPAEVTAIHGIDDKRVMNEPSFADLAPTIMTVLAGCVPGAYNAEFDKAFFLNEFERADFEPSATHGVYACDPAIEWIDPLIWARDIQSDQKSRKLVDVSARLGVIMTGMAHQAVADAESALRVMYILARDVRVPQSYGAFVQEQRRLSLAQKESRRNRRWGKKKETK